MINSVNYRFLKSGARMRRQIQARKCLNLHDLRNLVPQVVILKKCTDALFQRFLNGT